MDLKPNHSVFESENAIMSNVSRLYVKWLMVAVALAVVATFNVPAIGQDWARNDGSIPKTLDWSNQHLIYTAGYSKEQFEEMMKDPRAFTSLLAHGDPNVTALARGSADPSIRANLDANTYMAAHSGLNLLPDRLDPVRGFRPVSIAPTLKRDWAVSLGGTGGVAQGMYPAKYTFDVNATPSCVNDFAVFPINASTGNTRAHVVGTFSTSASSAGTVEFSVTQTGGATTNLTLTASTSSNSGTNFQVYTTASTANTEAEANNLAAAINRNLSGTALGEIVAVASSSAAPSTVTVYALTPGARMTMATPTQSGIANLSWATVVAGTNGSQANIVGLNELYSGSGTPLCSGLTYPEFTFSYASGVGPVATSPVISENGEEVAYVENDTTLGAILHVLTIGTGTEHATCTNSGTAAPTCATTPVIPGSTASSTATDYMLPLGLVGNKTPQTATTYEADSYSSPFVNYGGDILYVGDNYGYLYKISPVFEGSPPVHQTGFPVTVHSTYALSSPTVDVGNTGDIFVGDSDGILYNYSSGGTQEATLTVGTSTAGGVRDAPMVDSTNGVGYAVSCNSASDPQPVLTQFAFTGTTLTSSAAAVLDYTNSSGYPTACSASTPIPPYDPTPNNQYFTTGISSATAGSNGTLIAFGSNDNGGYYNFLQTYQFTSKKMSTTYYTIAYVGESAYSASSPLTEFYGDDVSYTISSVSQSGTTVSVTTSAANKFVVGQVVVISGISAGGSCTAADASAIDGEQTVLASGTTFTFTSSQTATFGTGNCAQSSPTAVGPTQDYLFFSTTTPAEVYTFEPPVGGSWSPTVTNTTDATGGTSAMIVDNDSSGGQASSIYFGTEATSTTLCGGTAAYCAIKLTQPALQ
jgi:hypothetical protein